MIEIAICDDDERVMKKIIDYVTEYMNKRDLIYEINTYRTGEELLRDDHYLNIIFLDVAMGDGMDGIIVGKKVHSVYRKTKIIYTTEFNQYMKKAFNGVHAFAYLEKPIKKYELVNQLEDVLNIIKEEMEQRQVVTFDVIEIAENHKIETMIKEFNIENIYYFEYINRRIRIRTTEGDFYFIDQMKNLINRMTSYSFGSCHQSYLINLMYIRRIKGYELYLKNGEKLPVSQKKSAEFRVVVNKFIRNNI